MIKHDKKELHEQTNMDKKVPLQDQFCYDTMLKSKKKFKEREERKCSISLYELY